MAGESAEQLARRQREHAERLLRSVEMYERGALGERATGAVLESLRHEGFVVFHDVRWPGRQRANIDHVVVGPPGVFVIDSKNWSGRIDVRDQTLRRDGRREDPTVAAAGDAALAVAALVGPEAGATTRSVLCFVREERLVGWCYDVMVCSTANLREMLLSRRPVLTPEQVRLTVRELEAGLRAAAPTSAPVASTPRPMPVPPRRPPHVPAPRQRPVSRLSGTGTSLTKLVVLVVMAAALVSQLPRLAAIGDVVGDQVTESVAPQSPLAYADCAALREDFPYGVGTWNAVNSLRPADRLPAVDRRVYEANRVLDEDYDGLVCVRG